jgi:hypothetical protein
VWKASFAFTALEPQHFERLKGPIRAEVLLRLGGIRKWKTVLREEIDFGAQPIHLQGLRMVDVVAGSSINTVPTKRWQRRTGES